MRSYRWTVPSRLISTVVDDPSSIPDKVAKHLASKGIQVEGVSIQNRVRLESPDGEAQYLEGPFLRIEADRDPTEELNALTIEHSDKEKDKADIKAFLKNVDDGKKPNQDATLDAVVAMARVLEQSKLI